MVITSKQNVNIKTLFFAVENETDTQDKGSSLIMSNAKEVTGKKDEKAGVEDDANKNKGPVWESFDDAEDVREKYEDDEQRGKTVKKIRVEADGDDNRGEKQKGDHGMAYGWDSGEEDEPEYYDSFDETDLYFPSQRSNSVFSVDEDSVPSQSPVSECSKIKFQ